MNTDDIKFKEELKQNVIDALNLKGVSPADIASDAPLFDPEGLDLDSVDALELVVMVESKYGISIDDKDEAKGVFATIDALADYIKVRVK